jgi:8-oxo-dGTP diphosphatase
MNVVGAVISNKRGEFLLQQRDDSAPSFRRCWTLFGGAIETNESPIEAILRELKEELALDLSRVVLVSLFRVYHQPQNVSQSIFEVGIEADIADLSLKEGLAMRFVEPAEFPILEFAFNIEVVLEDYLSFKVATRGLTAQPVDS